MKPKTKPLIILFFLTLISGLIFIPNNVDAVSYYNWIQNPSFITHTNYLEDNSFESGKYDSGLIYGNWSGTASLELGSANTGIYLVRIVTTDSKNTLWYNLTDSYNPMGADIVYFGFYARSGGSSYQPNVYIYYSDDSYDLWQPQIDWDDGEWIEKEGTSEINVIKNIVAIKVYHDGSTLYVDDFSLIVDDGGGQDALSMSTKPFFMLGTYPETQIKISDDFGRLDDFSLRLSYSTTYRVGQDFDYLDSDYVHFISVYAYSALNASEYDMGITTTLLYSDGTMDTKTEYLVAEDASWEYLNFGKSWIDINKYIVQIRFSVADTDLTIEKTIYIDDVGLWTSLPYGYSKFSFTISPQPINKGSYNFDAYSETTYTFNGYFYNISDLSLSIDGTYQIGDSFGLHSGNMTNGIFSLQLNKRSHTASPYTLETLSVTIVTEDEIFNVDIIAYWYPVSGGVDAGDAEQTASLITNFFMYGVFFLVIPLAVCAYTGASFSGSSTFNPALGLSAFVGAETLIGAIALSIGFIDLWFMAVIIIIDVLIIVTMMRSR